MDKDLEKSYLEKKKRAKEFYNAPIGSKVLKLGNANLYGDF